MLREVLAFFGVEFDDRELDKSNKTIDGSISKLKGLAAAVTGSALVMGIKALVSQVHDQALALSQLSGAVNISTDDIQRWQFLGSQFAVTGEDMGRSLAELNKRVGDAVSGGGDLQKRFKDLGVELLDSEDKVRSTGAILEDLRAGFSGLESGAERAAHADALFGEAGKKILPVLTATSEEIAALNIQFEELGGGLGSDTVKAFQDAQRTSARLDLSLGSLKANVAMGLLPIIEFLVEKTTKVIQVFNEATRDVDKTQFALVALGTAAVVAGVMFGGAFATALLPVAKAALVVAAVIAVTDDLITAYKGGRSTIAVFWKEWAGRNLAEDLHDAVNAADRLFTAFKGLARLAGFLVQSVMAIPKNLEAFSATSDYDLASSKLQDLLKQQRKIQAGDTGFFSGVDQRLANDPELLERSIQEQQAVVAEKKKRFDAAESAVSGADNVENRFEDLLKSIGDDADALNKRVNDRTAEGKVAGERSDENIRKFRHREQEEDAGMSLPSGEDDAIERSHRRQQREEQAAEAGMSFLPSEAQPVRGVDFGGNDALASVPDFTAVEQSAQQLAESNAALVEGGTGLQSSYEDAADQTAQLATTMNQTTKAADQLKAALSGMKLPGGVKVDNVNVFMQPGEGAREAGDRVGLELVDQLSSAMSSG